MKRGGGWTYSYLLSSLYWFLSQSKSENQLYRLFNHPQIFSALLSMDTPAFEKLCLDFVAISKFLETHRKNPALHPMLDRVTESQAKSLSDKLSQHHFDVPQATSLISEISKGPWPDKHMKALCEKVAIFFPITRMMMHHIYRLIGMPHPIFVM